MTAILAPIVAERADEPAVIDAAGITTWEQLDERVTRLVHALRERGLQTGESVVTMLGNQVELVEVAVACAHGGWVHVPLNWHSVGREVAYVVDDAQGKVVVADERWAHLIPAGPLRICVSHNGVAPDGFEHYEAVLAASHTGDIIDPARGGPMFYTSGTTGNPKGVRSSLAAVGGPPDLWLFIAHGFGPMIGVQPGARHVQLICGPMYHSAQWVMSIFTLFCGATLVLQHRFDAAEVLELVDTHEVTNMHLVPTQMVRMLDLPDDVRQGFDGSSLQSILHGAAPCPPGAKRRMIEWLGPIVTEYYGGTEGGFISMATAEEWLERPGTVGRPMAIMEVLVVGDDGAPVPANTPGEIWFRNLMGSDFEYHNAPEKTASAHREGGFATLGDIGYIDDDGYVFLSDRKIDMIVSGGVNIYPAEIEGILAEHPAIADVAVFGVPHDEMGESVHAVLVLSPGLEWSDELQAELDAFCRENLAGFKRPRGYQLVDVMPRSEAGKLTKRVLRDPWWADRTTAI